MTDPYAAWRYMLAHPEEIGKAIKITTTPIPGFYKRRMVKSGPHVPIWIYPEPDADGKWLARRTEDGGRVKEVDAHDEWMKCYGRPISQDVYEAVAERGEEWPGTDPIVGEQTRDRVKPGSNEPVDEAAILQDQINHALIGVEKYGQLVKWTKRGKTDVPVVTSLIKTDDDFAKAQTMRARLNELAGEGEELFEKEKAPARKESQRIDERWRFRHDATNGGLIVREAMATYQTAKLEAANKAERERLYAIEKARKAEEEADVSFVTREVPPEPAPLPAATAPVETTVKGNYGRAATLGAKWDVVAITDQDALYAYLKEHPETAKFLLGLAQRALDAGRDVPGIEKKIRATVS